MEQLIVNFYTPVRQSNDFEILINEANLLNVVRTINCFAA
jgi:hypothetical protein